MKLARHTKKDESARLKCLCAIPFLLSPLLSKDGKSVAGIECHPFHLRYGSGVVRDGSTVVNLMSEKCYEIYERVLREACVVNSKHPSSELPRVAGPQFVKSLYVKRSGKVICTSKRPPPQC